MADNRNLVLQLLITAKDDASEAFGKFFGFLDNKASAVATAVREAFTGLFGGGLTSAADLEAALDAVAAKGGYTAEEMVKLKQEAAKVAAQFGVTGVEAAQGLEILAAAGLNATDAVATLPQVLALARSEGVSMEVAAERLADSLAIMGLGFGEAGRMADVLAKGANLSTVSATQLAESLSTAGGVAKAAGLDLETTVAALDLLAKNGLKGERAGTGLAAVLTQLQNPASTAATALNAMGISTRDLGGVLDALQAGGAKSEAAILAFGETAGPALRALIGEGSAGIQAFAEQLRNADGAAQAASDQMGGNLKTALASLSAAWDSVKQAFLEPVLEPLAKAVVALTKSFTDAVSGGAFTDLTNGIKAIAKVAGEVAQTLAKAFDFKAIAGNVNSFIVGGLDVLGKAMNNVGAIAGGLAAAALIPLVIQLKAGYVATMEFIVAQRAAAAAMTATEIAAKGKALVMSALYGPVGWVMLGVAALVLLWKEEDKTRAATDALAVSTEEYTKKLKEQTEAQNRLALLKMDQSQAALRKELEATRSEWEKNVQWLDKVIAASKARGDSEAEAAAITKRSQDEVTTSRAKLDEQTKLLNDTEDRRKLILDELKAKQDAALPAMTAAEAALGKYRKAVEDANTEQANATRILANLTPGTQLYAEWINKLASAAAKGQYAQEQLTKAESDYNAGIQASLRDIPQATKNADAHATATGNLGGKISELKRATGESGAGMVEWNGTLVNATHAQSNFADKLELSNTKFKDLSGTIQVAGMQFTTTEEKLKEFDRQIKAGNDNAAAWSSGMELNTAKMMGLRDAAQAAGDKLKYLESIKATLPAGDNQIAEASTKSKEALDRYNTALGEHITQLEAKKAAVERSNALEQKGYDLLIQQAKAEEELANLKGDTTSATTAQTDATELQNQKATAAIAKKNEEIAVYAELIAATKEKLAADGSLNEADQAQLATMADTLAGMGLERDSMAQTLQATNDLTEAKKAKKEADEAAAIAAKEAADAEKEAEGQRLAAGKAFTAVLSGWAQRLNELSPAARTAFDGFVQGADVAGMSIEQLTERTSKNMAYMSEIITKSLGAGGFADWAGRVALKALEIEQNFLSQKIAVDSAAEALNRFADTGGNVAEAERLIAQYGEGANQELGLLDEQDLSNLRSAIDDANQKLRDMQQEVQDAATALAEMNAELLAEQGNTAGAERLKLQIEQSQRLAELEQKRLEAEATGNTAAAADYARMIALLDDVIAAKRRNLEAEIAGNDKTTATNQAAITQAGELATAIERTAAAAQTLNNVPLDGLQGRLQQLGESVNSLRSAL